MLKQNSYAAKQMPGNEGNLLSSSTNDTDGVVFL